MSCPPAAATLRACSPRAALGAACSVLALAWPMCARSTWILDVEAGWTHDSNLPRAQLTNDIKSGSALTAAFSAGRFFAPDERNSFTLAADARAARHERFSGLNFEALGATLGYRHKFGLGPLVPWASAALAAARDNFTASVRDSDRYNLTLEAGKRFSPRFEGSLGFTADRRDAHSSVPVFELRGRTGFVRGSFSVMNRLDATATYSVRSGDVVSSTRRNQQILRASTAIAPDPAFGPDYVAYRLHGVSRTPSLGLDWALGEYSTIRVVYTRELTYATGGLNYYSTVFNATFLHKF